jgi:membrane protease subunit (stomatin/prohibitin family)|tara:strand:- start:4688 stop:5674 length:987 start_codon:yes stop_codon:yes gene_type:complete
MAQLMEVLEFLDDTGECMVKRIPEVGPTEIKWGAQLTVRESQEVVFFRDGKSLDLFGPGRHILQTQNIPKITKWVTSFGYGQDSPFRAEVYFVGKQLFSNLKWGTFEPILFKDSELKMIRLRSFGSYSIQISDSMLFINKVVGTRGSFSNSDITDYLRSIIISKFTTVLAKNLKTVFDMPAVFDDFSTMIKVLLKDEFDGLGLVIHDFYLNSISVPDEVQEMIDQKSGMLALGNMDEFMKYKVAMSIGDAANQPGGVAGGLVGAGAGLGMGFAMPGMIQQTMGNAMDGTSNSSDSPLDKLKKLKELLDMEAISQEEFDEKKKELMNKM